MPEQRPLVPVDETWEAKALRLARELKALRQVNQAGKYGFPRWRDKRYEVELHLDAVPDV